MPAFLFHKRSPDGAIPNWGGRHLIGANCSFIDHEGMKGWVGLVGWPISADGLPIHKRSPIIYRSSAGQGSSPAKDRRSTTVLRNRPRRRSLLMFCGQRLDWYNKTPNGMRPTYEVKVFCDFWIYLYHVMIMIKPIQSQFCFYCAPLLRSMLVYMSSKYVTRILCDWPFVRLFLLFLGLCRPGIHRVFVTLNVCSKSFNVIRGIKVKEETRGTVIARYRLAFYCDICIVSLKYFLFTAL